MVKTNCYLCIHRKDIPGDSHSSCSKPDKKMTGKRHGIESGWFVYPSNYDPIWMTKECDNFEKKGEEEKNDKGL